METALTTGQILRRGRVSYQFKGQRKPQEYVVYPYQGDGKLKVQADSVIGYFDFKTRKGLINKKGSNPKYNVHLSPALGAEPFEFPQDFVDACKSICGIKE
jgi:hypothetical protein